MDTFSPTFVPPILNVTPIHGYFFTGEETPTFVPPILNVTPIHGYFFTGEETGSADRAGGLTCALNLSHSGQHPKRHGPTLNSAKYLGHFLQLEISVRFGRSLNKLLLG
jgi:hypothetical protein